jgi:hypothetical protein
VWARAVFSAAGPSPRWVPSVAVVRSTLFNMKQALINIRNSIIIYAVVYVGVVLLAVTGAVYIIVDSAKRRAL